MDTEIQANELVALPDGMNAFNVFAAKDSAAIDSILAQVRAKVDAFDGDVSTSTGRKAIASFARKISTSKTFLEEIGSELAREQKEIPKRIDANRKHMKDTLDKWRDEVRAPLDQWEAAETARLDKHKAGIARIVAFSQTVGSSGEYIAAIAALESVEITPAACEEFVDEYRMQVDLALQGLRSRLEGQRKHEAEQAELAALRAEKAKRDAEDAAERLRKEGEERVRLEAEADARAQAAESARQRKEAEDAAALRELTLQREIEAQKRRAEEAEAKAKADQEAKIRAGEEAKREREADVEHRRRINADALADIVAGGLTEKDAKAALTLIIGGHVRRVTINY